MGDEQAQKGRAFLDLHRADGVFIELKSGQIVLIAHNVDLAGRIELLEKGDRVEFNGEYEWNPRGGVVHCTHRDPADRHVSGWIKHNGRTYQ